MFLDRPPPLFFLTHPMVTFFGLDFLQNNNKSFLLRPLPYELNVAILQCICRTL